MRCQQVLDAAPPKVFQPIKIEIVFQTQAELEYVRDKVRHWSVSGTYPLYELLSNLYDKSK